jgi:hypothetical protein
MARPTLPERARHHATICRREGMSDNPARAWLLAILRALHAMEGAKQ